LTILIYSILLFIGLGITGVLYFRWKFIELKIEIERLQGLLDAISEEIRTGKLIRKKYSDIEIERLR
jgi:hypothetical protein